MRPSICICRAAWRRSSNSASRPFPKASAMPGATIALRPRTRWPRWRASISVTETALAAANQLRAQRQHRRRRGAGCARRRPPPRRARTRLYTVRRGDTLVTIADRFGVSLNQLRRWNKITGIKVKPGQRLHVADPASVPRAARSRTSVAARSRAQRAPRQSRAARTAQEERAPAAKKAPAQRSEPLPARRRAATAGARKSPREETRRGLQGSCSKINMPGTSLHTCHLMVFACKLLLQ